MHLRMVSIIIYTHPEVKAKINPVSEPWFALLWTDGSISAINTADVGAEDVKSFFIRVQSLAKMVIKEGRDLASSNGTIAPSKSISGRTRCCISIHVTFISDLKLHIQSKQGLMHMVQSPGDSFCLPGFQWKVWLDAYRFWCRCRRCV